MSYFRPRDGEFEPILDSQSSKEILATPRHIAKTVFKRLLIGAIYGGQFVVSYDDQYNEAARKAIVDDEKVTDILDNTSETSTFEPMSLHHLQPRLPDEANTMTTALDCLDNQDELDARANKLWGI